MSTTPETNEILLGTLTNTTGIFTIGDVEEIDTRWMTPSMSGGGGWVMDITGPHAEVLASRLGMPREKLIDGTWRVKLHDQQVGLEETKLQIGAQGWQDTDKAVVYASQASRLVLHDAARANKAGMVAHRLAAFLPSKGKSVLVYASVDKATGDITGLRIAF